MFPAWNMEWRDRQRPPLATLGERPPRGSGSPPHGFGGPQIEVVEAGPVRVSLQITRDYGDSRFVQQVRLSCGDAGERVEFLDQVDWHETGVSLKAAFPLAVSAPEASYNWELGVVRRGNNDDKKFEVPAHQWFDLTDADGSYGVTVLEDGKYGSDKPSDNMLRLTLLFTPRVGLSEFMFRDQASQDWGRHRFAYGLYGHRGDWREAGSTRQALRLNQPPQVFRVTGAQGGARGPLGKQVSFLSLNTEQVGLRALKMAEDRDSLILRFYELWGRPADEVELTLNPDLVGQLISAWETDGCERRLGVLGTEVNSLRFEMGAFGIKTIELQLGPGVLDAQIPAYQPLALPHNLCAYTTDAERTRGALPGGRSFPRELLPAQVTCASVPLTLALDKAEGALACCGQEIPLPEGGYDTLLLLASADEDLEATFYLDETPVRLSIQAGEGFIGQGDRRTWDRVMEKQPQYRWWAVATGVVPGYLKRDRVGCYTTHMHSAAGNEAYAFGYMFLYRLPLPTGARLFRVPDDPRLRIYAATVAKGVLETSDAAR
jgi:alpha-mannosidase